MNKAKEAFLQDISQAILAVAATYLGHGMTGVTQGFADRCAGAIVNVLPSASIQEIQTAERRGL